MLRLNILCILILVSVCSAEDMMFFADDHYKVIGEPIISATAVNPVLSPEENVLVIKLGNIGRVTELIPTLKNGSDEDIMKEIRAEMHSVDATNITATLHSSGPVDVLAEPRTITIASLPSGSVARIEFNISAGEADGWYDLPLTLDYEHQADVMVNNGSVIPLYQPESRSIPVKIFIEGNNGPGIEGVKSDLHTGEAGTILAAVTNHGYEIMGNCTAKLMAAPYFVSESVSHLGDIAPGRTAVAEFAVSVDRNASSSNNIPCELSYDGGSTVLQIPVTLNSPTNPMIYILIALLLILAFVTVGLLWKKRRLKTKWRKFSR